MNGWLARAGLIVLLGAGALAGCGAGNGSASCKESCDTDNDCAAGLGCFNTTDGQICLPSGCGACYDSQRTCGYSENTDEQTQGDQLTCEFSQCW